jgi:transposase
MIASQHPGRRIEVWFQDEARFGQQGTITRKWAPTGSRPPAVKQTQYDWLYVIGAVCPESGRSVGMLSPYIDTQIMNIFLQGLSRQIAPDVHVVLIWDQAGFHTSGALKVPKNITVLALPPYSPELNPVENLWHYLRAHHWANREYPEWKHLSNAACEAWQKVCLDHELMKTVCNAPYLTRGIKT